MGKWSTERWAGQAFDNYLLLFDNYAPKIINNVFGNCFVDNCNSMDHDLFAALLGYAHHRLVSICSAVWLRVCISEA